MDEKSIPGIGFACPVDAIVLQARANGKRQELRLLCRSLLDYTSPVSVLIRPGIMRATLLLAMLPCIALIGGCASAWLTVTPTGVTPAPTTTPDRARNISPTPTPLPRGTAEVSSRPTPGSQLASLSISDAPLQSWSNPNDVNGLLYDGQYLWAATGGGVVRWQPDSGESRVYTLNDGLASLAIRGIAQDGEGHIWVGYVDHGTWSEYDGERWYSYESREKAVASRYRAMLTASQIDPRLWSRRDTGDWVWLPSSDGRVEAYDGSKWRVYGQREGVTQNTWLVAVTAGGRVWAVGEGVSTTEEGERQWEDHSLPGEAPEDSETADLAVDGQGRAWLAFVNRHRQGAGVGCLDPTTNRWVAYTHALNPAIPRQVHRLGLDRDGTVWLCGDEGIAFCRPGARWEPLSWGISVQSFARDREGRFWIGTAHGICSAAADGSDLRGPWLVRASIISNEITSLVMDGQGTLWIGTPKGLSYAAASGDAGIALDEEVFCLATGPKDEVWAGTRSGLYILRGAGSSQQVFDQPVARLVFDAQGILWICTQDGRIGPLDGAEWRPKASVAELATAPPRDMLVSADGSVWLGTANGLGVLSVEGSFAWADPEEHLLQEDARALALGPDGVLWIGTANGLARQPAAGGWVRLTPTSTEGGLRSTEIWDLHMTPEGTLWIATSAGISMRTPKADWFYFDLPGARTIWPESSEVIWVGTRGGLYRLRRELLIAVP